MFPTAHLAPRRLPALPSHRWLLGLGLALGGILLMATTGRVYALAPRSSDTTPATVTITSPEDGATVSGTILVTASASDNVGVVRVRFRLDGVNLGARDTSAPYAVSWNTTTASNGPHTLTAVARDAAGNTTTSAPITVTVSSPVTSPGTVTDLRVTTTASDGITLAFTEANDGTGNPAKYDVRYAAGTTTWGSASDVSSGTCSAPLLGTTIGATKSCTVLGLAPSTLYQFQLVAFRGTLNIDAVFGDLSNIVGATTPSLADTIPPTASITSPASGATVSGTTFTVSANASDNVGVVGVQFKLDGANLGVEDTTGPYAISWNTTTASDGTHTLTAVARDSAGNQTVSGVTVTVSNTSAPPSPKGGIAARYPGDVGIEADPNVIFVERFDEATLTDLFGRWTDILNGPAMQFSTDVPPGSPGSRSLNIPWVGGGVNNGGHLYKQLIPGVGDTLYVRYYIKYPTSGTYQHTGVWMGGHNPPLPWPDPQAGLKPAGNDRFSAAAEQNPLTSRFDHYNYWMGMHQSADGNFWGNVLLNDPTVQARTGQWMCVEHMVKLNNPTTSLNGEHAIWLDGVNVSHLGQGFPNGSWTGGIFTQNPTGVPFEGFSWRSDATLNINWIWLQNYASTDPAGFSGTMKFAHVVTAKSYIGCLTSGSSDTTPPTVSVTAPAVGAIVSGSTVTVSATASDNVGVVGVQFTLDGANLGVEDAAATYSKSWNTTTVSNGLHTLSAVARDAAGNTTASAAVTVTVSNLLSSAWPNEPTGLTVLVDWGLDLAVPTAGDVPILGSPGWNVVGNAVPGSAQGWAQLALDPSAPVSPANVYDFVYPAGMIEGEAPATVYYNLAAGEMYAGFWWKPSSPFDTGPNGNKIAFLFNGGGGAGGQQFLILMPDGRLHVLPEYPGDFRWRTPNVNATLVTLGQWHRIEWYCQLSTGTLKWWLDGVLQGSYTDVRNSHSFDMFQFSPTWGGNSGARKRETDHYWFDQVHLSVR